uniref:Uncharacterized protein n=1 Tax=Panagrolaimus sp. PS1159 TaxID=55785 RepID=A0AC35GWK1_9BILA
MLNEEKIAELTKIFSNYEQISEKTSSSQNSISNHNSSTSSEGSESSEEMISVFPIFSLLILFFYQFMQITTNVFKRAIGNKPNSDEQSTKTDDDERNVHE